MYAVKLLIEHGYGKPPRETQLEIEDTTAAETPLTGQEMVQRVAEMLPRILGNGMLGRPELLECREAIDAALERISMLEGVRTTGAA